MFYQRIDRQYDQVSQITRVLNEVAKLQVRSLQGVHCLYSNIPSFSSHENIMLDKVTAELWCTECTIFVLCLEPKRFKPNPAKPGWYSL